MGKRIIKSFFLFCLILSSICCVQKSVIQTHPDMYFSNAAFTKLNVSVHTTANQSNTKISVICDKIDEAKLVRVEVNGERIYKNEEFGNFVGFKYEINSLKKINRVVLGTYDGNVRKEYELEVTINPIDFVSERISNFDRFQNNFLPLSRVYNSKNELSLDIPTNTTSKETAKFNESKDAIVIASKLAQRFTLAERELGLRDFDRGSGISDDGAVGIIYETLYVSNIKLDVTN